MAIHIDAQPHVAPHDRLDPHTSASAGDHEAVRTEQRSCG
jgi:hypothetical protein